jgi:drug/metabolite transporter (DMT)-like permease
MVNRGVQNIPPLLFAAFSAILACVASFIYTAFRGKLHELKRVKAWFPLIMVTLCIVVIPYTLLFIGASKTSGTNTSVLLLSEIIFTLIFTPFIGEKTTLYKIIGAGGVFFGALLILFNGKLQLNIGDLLIILSTVPYPIGNFYAKKAMNIVSPATILFVRFILGGLFLFALAALTIKNLNIQNVFIDNWKLILFNGLILLGIGKMIWYSGLKRLDISKGISLIMTFPLFSLIVLVGVFNEQISIYQWVGIAIMMIGVFFTIKRSSVDPAKTKYTPEYP